MTEEKKEEIAPLGNTSLQALDADRPDDLAEGDVRGTENIGSEDMQIPRLGLAQGLSPQVIHGKDRYIEGLAVGQMFNNLTNQIYGRGPLEFMVLRVDRPRGIEFFPLDQGGGIKDFNVPLDDPRMQFGPNGEIPIATKFYDFIIALLFPDRAPEIIAFSLKSSGLSTARQLNSLIQLRNAPCFAGKYKLTTGSKTNKKGTFSVFNVQNSDIVNDFSFVRGDRKLPGWVNKELRAWGERKFEALKSKKVEFEREVGADDDNFDPEEIERNSQVAGQI